MVLARRAVGDDMDAYLERVLRETNEAYVNSAITTRLRFVHAYKDPSYEETATLENFQRVRGMLRLLTRTIANLWDEKPGDATAIQVHHIDPGYEPIRQEIVTSFGQSRYLLAISNDIAGVETKALAQEIDDELHAGMPSLHSIRHPNRLPPYPRFQRAAAGHLTRRASVLGPLPRDRCKFHRRGLEGLWRGLRLPRRPTGC